MNRLFLLSLGLLAAGGVCLLASCASDSDELSPRQDPAAEGAELVPGAATPAPDAHSAGWW